MSRSCCWSAGKLLSFYSRTHCYVILQNKYLSAMVVFSILLVEEMFAFKYATVRLFGGKNITEFFVDPLLLFNYNARVS